MEAYHNLAQSYDRLTNDVDYRAIVDFYQSLLDREGLKPRTAVDLACGTGSVALLLAEAGMQVTGVDMSTEMLCMADQKACGMENRPVFACQKLQNLHLPKGVDLAVCALDGLDYLTNPTDLERGMEPVLMMGKLAALLHQRYRRGLPKERRSAWALQRTQPEKGSRRLRLRIHLRS